MAFNSSDDDSKSDNDVVYYDVIAPASGRLVQYFSYIGQRFMDLDENKLFRVVAVCKCNKFAGYFFKYVSDDFIGDLPDDDDVFEYTKCIEMLKMPGFLHFLVSILASVFLYVLFLLLQVYVTLVAHA